MRMLRRGGREVMGWRDSETQGDLKDDSIVRAAHLPPHIPQEHGAPFTDDREDNFAVTGASVERLLQVLGRFETPCVTCRAVRGYQLENYQAVLALSRRTISLLFFPGALVQYFY